MVQGMLIFADTAITFEDRGDDEEGTRVKVTDLSTGRSHEVLMSVIELSSLLFLAAGGGEEAPEDAATHAAYSVLKNYLNALPEGVRPVP